MKISTTQLLLVIAFSSFLSSYSYSQNIQWEKSYGGKNADYLMDVEPTADYGFILAGSSLSTKSGNKTELNRGDFDYWIWKMKENGDLDWQKSFGGSGSDFLQSIKNTNDGGFILAGVSNSSIENNKASLNDKKDSCRGYDDFWIIKLDAKGNEEWQRTIGGKGQEKLKSIIKTTDGGYLLAGSSSSNKSNEKTENSFGSMDYWVVKLDRKGEIEWQKTYGGIYSDELKSVEQTKDSGYILGGISNSPASGNKSENNIGYNDYWVVKIDKKGIIEWQKTIGGTLDDQLSVIHQSYDSGYILAGNSNSNFTKSKKNKEEYGTDFLVVKIDEQGTKIWQQNYNIGNNDVLTSMIENKDHSILLGGYAQSETGGTFKKDENGINDYVAIKISEKGEEFWRKSVGSKGEDVLQKAIETRDGGYLFVGTSNPTKSNNIPVNVTALKKGFENEKSNEQLKNATSTVSNTVNETKDKANEFYKETVGGITDKVNNSIGLDKDSPVKMDGVKKPLGNDLSFGSGNSPSTNSSKQPPSKDKKINYGSTDFWVVKIKDNDKPTVAKVAIEAFPNPATNFTNIIVGYDFVSGTATLVDLSGRVLQSFSVTERTIPIDLQSLPEGIYVVNIKTEKQSDGIKIIKNISKN